MVKVHKMFCIDVEIADRLTEVNASELVNMLLMNHFGSSRESIDRRKATLTKELAIVEAEEGEINVVEAQTEKENAIRERIEAERDKKIKGYKAEKDKLTKRVKKKDITFDEYMELSRQLKEKWGL